MTSLNQMQKQIKEFIQLQQNLIHQLKQIQLKQQSIFKEFNQIPQNNNQSQQQQSNYIQLKAYRSKIIQLNNLKNQKQKLQIQIQNIKNKRIQIQIKIAKMQQIDKQQKYITELKQQIQNYKINKQQQLQSNKSDLRLIQIKSQQRQIQLQNQQKIINQLKKNIQYQNIIIKNLKENVEEKEILLNKHKQIATQHDKQLLIYKNKLMEKQQEIRYSNKIVQQKQSQINKMKQIAYENQRYKNDFQSQKQFRQSNFLKNFQLQKLNQSYKNSNYTFILEKRSKMYQKGIKQIGNYLKIIQNKQQKQISIQQINSEEIISMIYELQNNHYQIFVEIVQKIMNQPLTQQQQKQNDQIQKQLQSINLEKASCSINVVLRCLKQQLQHKYTKVLFKKRRSAKSIITMNALSSGLLFNRYKCQQTIEDNQYQNSFQSICNNKQNYQKFIKFAKQRLKNNYGFNQKTIVIHSIKKGSTIVSASGDKQKLGKQYCINYLQSLYLSNQDFDKKGDIEFQNQKDFVQTRGGWPYYQPIKCIRFGLKVWNQYDNKNNDWLMMDNRKKQWVVAFHGVTCPESITSDSIRKQLIESQPNKKLRNNKIGNIVTFGLREGPNQVRFYQGDTCLRTGLPVTKGIYCTPHFNTALEYTSKPNDQNNQTQKKKYRLVLQCRANPDKIQICDGSTHYLVIQNPKDIRQYGIILINQQNYGLIIKNSNIKHFQKHWQTQIQKYKRNKGGSCEIF